MDGKMSDSSLRQSSGYELIIKLNLWKESVQEWI